MLVTWELLAVVVVLEVWKVLRCERYGQCEGYW